MRTYCLVLDLKDDHALIAEYRRYHQRNNIWPEVVRNIKSQGILSEEIFQLGARMVMVLRTTDDFSFEAKAAMDHANHKMAEWERLMRKYQQPEPQVKFGEKWALMDKIFEI